MQNRTVRAFLTLVAAITLCSFARAQNGQPPQQGQGRGAAQAQKDKTPAAPAPARDINGVWAGSAAPPVNPAPPMTPYGQARAKTLKPFFGPKLVPVSESNDPMIKCDPLGFPRDVMFEIRGSRFVQIPNEMLVLYQYQKVWREIWTDGRALPTNVGGDGANAPDPRYYGYSVGHWGDDYNFIVDTVGLDERTWLDAIGDPKSSDAKVQERYHRLDHDTLEMNITVDDPKVYTKTWAAETFNLKWNPKQEFEEQLCIPSEMEVYMKTIGNPAGGKEK
jgi:hypothetical protein